MPNQCETCGGQLGYLGGLGNLEWFRCMQCGMQQSHKAPEYFCPTCEWEGAAAEVIIKQTDWLCCPECENIVKEWKGREVVL